MISHAMALTVVDSIFRRKDRGPIFCAGTDLFSAQIMLVHHTAHDPLAENFVR